MMWNHQSNVNPGFINHWAAYPLVNNIYLYYPVLIFEQSPRKISAPKRVARTPEAHLKTACEANLAP